MNPFAAPRLAKLILPIIIADMALLPMFHVGEVPWKPSLLLILSIAVTQIKRRNFSEIKPAIPAIALSALLFGLTVIGAISYWIVSGVAPGTETFRLLTIFVLIPASFLVGLTNQRSSHMYIGWIVIVMVALNIGLFSASDQMSSLATFYGLDRIYLLQPLAYDPTSEHARPAGIFQNANVSSLGLSVIVTYMVLGLKWGFFRPHPALLVLFVGTGLFGIAMLLGKTQLIAAAILMTFAFFWSRGFRKVGIVISGLIVLVLVGFIPSPIGTATESALGLQINERLVGGFSHVAKVGLATIIPPTQIIPATQEIEPTVETPPTQVIGPTAETPPTEVIEPTVETPPTLVVEPTAETPPTEVIEPTMVVQPTPVVTPAIDVVSSPLGRPFISWDPARERITDPPWLLATGSGSGISPKHGSARYHNDWISILVSAGIPGLLVYSILVAYFGAISLLIALPFFIPGLVNAFLFSPQFIILISILAGIVMRFKLDRRCTQIHGLDVVYLTIDSGLSLENSPVLKSQIGDAAISLASAGHNVGLIANVQDPTSKNIAAYRPQLAEVTTVRNASIPVMLFKAAWILNRLNRQNSINKIYVRGIWGAITTYIAFPAQNGPEIVYDFRGDIVAEARSTGTRGVRLLILRLLTQIAIRPADRHLSVSTPGASTLENNYGAKNVVVIPSSTDVAKSNLIPDARAATRKSFGFNDDDTVCVYSGGLASYQMIPEMLSVWKNIAEPKIKFLLLTNSQPGHNTDLSNLNESLPPNTTILSLDPDAVAAHLAAADIGFLLRQTDPLNTVASPVKFAEYLAAGLAVVTSPAVNDVAEQVKLNNLGVVISPTPDTSEFNLLRKFIEEFPELKNTIRTQAVSVAQAHFDWNSYASIWQREILGEIELDSAEIPTTTNAETN